MTDRTDSDAPAPQEPSSGRSADEVVWPVWGATPSTREELGDETRPNPVVHAPEPSAADEPSADDSATAGTAADESASDEPATDEPASDEAVSDDSASDEAVSDEAASDEAASDEGEAVDAASDEVAPATAAADESAPASDEAGGAPDAEVPTEGTVVTETEPAAAAESPADDDAATAAPEAGEPGTSVPDSVEAVDAEPEAAVGDATGEAPTGDVAETAGTGDVAPAEEPVADSTDEQGAAPTPAAPAEEAETPVPPAPAAEDATDEPSEPAADSAGDESTAPEPAATPAAAPRPVAVFDPAAVVDAPTPTPADEAGSTPVTDEPTAASVADEPAVDEPAVDEPEADAAADESDASEADEPEADAAAGEPDASEADEPAVDETPAGAADESAPTDARDEASVAPAESPDESAPAAPAAGDEAPTQVVVPALAPDDRSAAETTVLPPVPAQVERTPAAPAAAGPAAATPVTGSPARESVFPRRESQDATVVLPAAAEATTPTAAPAQPAPPVGGPPRVTGGPVPEAPRPDSPFDDFASEERTHRWPRRLAVTAGVVVLLGAAYVGASYLTADRVARGASVAGVEIGGLTADAAVERLESELAPTTQDAVEVVANDAQATLDPQAAGLTFDARATVDRLTGVDLADPKRLWDQVVGLGEQEPVTQVDEARLTSALEALGTSLSLAPVDGAVMFVDGSAVMTDASEGWALDQEAAAEVVARDWLVGAQPLALPTVVVEPEITQAEAQAALDEVAKPLVSAPISVEVAEKLAVLQPATLAAAASMQPQDGELVLQLDGEALAQEVVAQLPEGVLTSASDARFEFQGDKPVLVPGEPGTTVAPDDVAQAVAQVVSAQDRTATVELSQTDPKESTEALEKLGIKEVVGEFSTPLTSEPRRTQNIRQGLANITGVLIRPGETFSLTESLGPIDAAHGFVQAGAIVNGEHSDAWGGGLSQVSTTTYNAAFLAGMEDVEHTPHSEWFTRYPEGREATIFTGVIDMKWKNTTPYGALVQGWVANGRAYVRIWGTKYWTVEHSTSGRSGVVQPSTVYSTSRTCTPQAAGNPGFSVTVTRRLLLDGELKDTTTNTWRYKPQNRVVCGKPPSKDKDDDKKDEKDAAEGTVVGRRDQ